LLASLSKTTVAAVGGDLGVVAATIALHPAGIGRHAQRIERRRLIHHVARVIDDIGVVAQPALEQVGARAAGQRKRSAAVRVVTPTS
jgi:hypothetical protein